MSWMPMRTPASWKMRAESSRPRPTRPQRLLVRPRAAEALDERRLGRHPVRLGVDEGAVHVPEDCGQGGRVHWSMLVSAHRSPGRAGARGRAAGARPAIAARAYPGWTPQMRAEEVAWTDWDAGCSSPHSTAGTTPARRHPSAIAHLRESGEYETCVLDRPRAVLRLPVHAAAGRHRRRRQADAPLARGDAPQARAARRAAPSCGCSPASSRRAPGRRSRREFIDVALREDITGFVALGSMMSDVPHTRPISVFAGSDSEQLRTALDLERSTYEGPVGILSVLVARGRCRRHPVGEPLGERAALRRRSHAVAEGDARAPRPARGPHRRAGAARRARDRSPRRGRPRSTRPRPTTRR